MEKRHDDLLTARIEELAEKGWSFIHWWEAYLWYDQKKLGKNFWRDLEARFANACAQKVPPKLYIYEKFCGGVARPWRRSHPHLDKIS